MTDTGPVPENDAQDAGNFCYRHPDRQSFIVCQRCGRTICPDCMTPAAVGVHCPECVRESRASAPRQRPAIIRSARRLTAEGQPAVTYSIIGVTAFVFVLQLVFGGLIENYLVYRPVFTALLPWTMLTSVFLHGGFAHILFNMFSLFIFGRIIEQSIGRARFLTLYLLSGFGGSVAVLLLNPGGGVLGASGAVFGLMGAFFVIARGLGGNASSILVLVGLNLVLGFVIPGISWQAHVGGLITGALTALIFMRTRSPRQKNRQILLTSGVAAALIAITVTAFIAIFTR